MNKFTECSATRIYKEIVSTRQNNLLLKYTIYRQNSQLVQNIKPNSKTDYIDTE